MISAQTSHRASWSKWLAFYVSARVSDAVWRVVTRKADVEIWLTRELRDIYQSQEVTTPPLGETVSRPPSSFESPDWRTFGFRTKEEYEFWCVRLCAIACLRIALNYFHIDLQTNLATIAEWCRVHGGYDIEADRGWTHRSLAAYLKSQGLKVSLGRFLLWPMILHNLRRSGVLIVSIKEGKRGNPLAGDGHLVVLVGASEERGKRWVHYLDPASPDGTFMNQASSMTWGEFLRLYRLRFIQVERTS